MLSSTVETFTKYYENVLREENRDIILSEYKLDLGTYVYVNLETGTYKRVDVSKKNDGKVIGDDFKEIVTRDYLSKLLDMNKPIDSKKIIQSNNCYSFVIKKESQTNGKLNNERIHEYFEFSKNLKIKYAKDKYKLEILNSIDSLNDEELKIRDENIFKIKNWIEENIFKLEVEGKDYLKIYFNIPIKNYQLESDSYLLANVYNKNDFNIVTENIVYGLPNNNMGMNDKKPYLENKSRKITTPYLITLNEVKNQKRFFDYLLILASNKKNYIYLGYDNKNKPILNALEKNDIPRQFSGSFFKIKKGKEAIIMEYDTIDINNINKEKIIVYDFFELIDKKIKNIPEYGSKTDLFGNKDRLGVFGRFNNKFFSGHLNSCMFDPEEFSVKSNRTLEYDLKILAEGFYNWFYKGNRNNLKNNFQDLTLKIMIEELYEGKLLKCKLMFNIREALGKVIGRNLNNNGEINMKNKFKDIRQKLEDICLGEEVKDFSFETKEEYSYVMGQVSYYLLSLSEANMGNKNHNMVKPILGSKNPKRTKNLVIKLFEKYSYKISLYNKRINKLMSTIMASEDLVLDKEFFLGGYLSDNIMFKKAKKNQNGSEE